MSNTRLGSSHATVARTTRVPLVATLIALVFATTCAWAAPVVVVNGTAVDGSRGSLDGWVVSVANTTFGWRQNATVGETRSGAYQVTRAVVSGRAARAGDVLKADLIDPSGVRYASKQRTATNADIVAASVTLDFVVDDPSAEPLQAALLAAWPFDEGGGTLARDASGLGGNGVVVGSTNRIDGVFGGALQLSRGAYVEVPHTRNLHLTGTDFTLSMWVRYQGNVDTPRAFMGVDDGTGSQNKWLWVHRGSQSAFHMNDTNGVQTWLDSDFWDPVVDRWTHVAVTREGPFYTHYRNGRSLGTLESTRQIPSAMTEPLRIGVAEQSFSFEGVIDDAAMFGRALSQSEIRTLMDDGIAPYFLEPVPTAVGTPRTFAVYGTTADPNGVAPDGWTATVANTSRGWAEAVVVGTDRSGLYAAARVEPVGRAATAGDVIRVTLRRPDGAHRLSTERPLGAADIGRGYLRLDFDIPEDLIQGDPPTVRLVDIDATPFEDVVIQYELGSATRRTLALAVDFSTDDGITWERAQTTGEIEEITPNRYGGSVVWSSLTRFPGRLVLARVRLTAADASRSGPSVISDEFQIQNAPPPTEALGVLPHGAPAGAVAFSPDSSVLATGSDDGFLRLWSSQSRVLFRTIKAHDKVLSVSFSPDGGLIASGGADRAARLWDAQSHALVASLDGHTNWVYATAFSPRAPVLATGSWDGSVKLWDIDSHTEITTLGVGHAVWSIAFSPDGSLMAASQDDGSVVLWDMANPRAPVHTDTLMGHSGAVRSVAFSPDGLRLATGGWDHTVLVWERRPGGRFRELVAHRGHESSVWSVAFSPDGSLLASASVDTTVRAWYPSGPGQLAVLAGHGATVRAVAFSPDDNLLASGGDDGAVTLWTSPVVSLNVAPRISVSKTAITVLEGAAASLVVSATDPEGDPLVFSASGMPDNATLNAQTGRFRIEPDYTQSGRYTVEFSVSDGRRGLDSVSVTVRVTAADLFRIQAGPRRVAGGETLTLTLAANGAVPDGVAIAANGLPDNASFNAARRRLTFTPDLTQAGSYDVTFRVTQDGRLAEQHAVTLNVDHSDAFALTPWEPQTIGEGETLSVQADRTENAGATTVLTASALPPNATFDAATGDLRFTPDYTQTGSYTITVRATQGGEVVQTERMRVTVVEANPFTLNPSGPQLVSEGLTRVIAVELAPAARGVVTLSAGGLPPNASFDPSTNELSFTPAFGQIGEFTIAIQASQNGVAVQTEEILLSVGAAEAFTLDPSAPAAVAEGQSVVVRAIISDDAPDTITVAPRDLPTNASYDASTGALTFTPDYTQAGNYTITFEALQNGSPVQSKDALISVSDADVFALDPGTTFAIAEGETTVVSITGDVAALNAVTLSAVGLPPNATLDLPTRRLTFSPDYTQSGEHRITIQARQNGQVVQTDEVSVTVADVRVFSLAPSDDLEIVEGAVATVSVIRDVEAADVVVSVSELPTNAVYDDAVGEVTFAPNYTQAGEYTLTVRATQDGREVGSESLRVVVTNVPTFTLSPAGAVSLNEGAEATVRLTRADGVSDDVTFNVTGLPRNASYDAGTGALVFAPDFSQQGSSAVVFHAFQDGVEVDSESVAFTVRNVDVLSLTPSGAHRVDEGGALSVRAVVAASAQGAVTLSAVDVPANASFNAGSGLLTFNPSFTQAGRYSPTIRAVQAGRTVDEETLSITVVDVNVPPTVDLTAPADNVTGDVTVTYAVEDFDGDRVSLEVEYREGGSGAWVAATLDRAVTNTTTYNGGLVWKSREDIPSTGGVDVEVRVTPSDSDTGTPATTDSFVLVNLLGDYDEDMRVGFDDLAAFTQGWREDDTSRDIGPTTGTPPELVPDLDDAMDFEDLATFIQMWNWSADNAPLAAPAMTPAVDTTAMVRNGVTVDRSDWRRQTVRFALDEPASLLAARVTVQYDPTQLRLHRSDASDGAAVAGGRLSLDRHDEARGVLDLQTAWLAEDALADTLASIQVESLRETDAELRLTFDIRDRFNNARRERQTFRLFFRPPPAATALLQNYPNPFNPETWIPFDLSEDAEVTVTVYDLGGALIRTLHLGALPTGRYHARDRAAYWDGANESGETAASGVYIYELRAGPHRENRRMVIRK